MKKSNITGDVAVMERSTGVLARPKTLPLKPDDTSSSSFCYLQLRNRRLHRSPPPSKQPQSRGKTWKPQNLSSNSASTSSSNSKPNSSLRLNSIRSGSVKSAPHGCDGRDVQGSFDYKEMRQNDINEVGTEEASFGEKKLELEPRDRYNRISLCYFFLRKILTFNFLVWSFYFCSTLLYYTFSWISEAWNLYFFRIPYMTGG